MTKADNLISVLEETKRFNPYISLPGLQYFAEGEGEGEGDDDGSGDDDGAGDDTGDDDDDGKGDDDTDDSDGSDDTTTKTKKSSKKNTFSQTDVNNVAAREAKKAQEKLLKQLGVKDINSAKEGLKKFKEQQDSQKSEADKAIERATALEEENTTFKNTVEDLNAKLSAVTANVNSDYIDDVVVLAKSKVSDEVDMEQAINDVVEKYPHFKESKEDNDGDKKKKKKPNFSKGDHKADDKKNDDKDAWVNAFKWGG